LPGDWDGHKELAPTIVSLGWWQVAHITQLNLV